MSMEQDPSRRIVVTGMGTVNPLGSSVEETWGNLLGGYSGIQTMPENLREPPIGNIHTWAPLMMRTDPENWQDIPELKQATEQLFGRKGDRKLHMATRMAMLAVREALFDSGLSDGGAELNGVIAPELIGLYVGTGAASADAFHRVGMRVDAGFGIPPSLTMQTLPERIMSSQSQAFGIKGPGQAISAACSSGNAAMISAIDKLLSPFGGPVDAMVCVGAEAHLNRLGFGLFANTGALDETIDPASASRPLHRAKNGFVMGEASGAIVIEKLSSALARGANIHGEIIGYGATSDANKESDTLMDEVGPARAVRDSMLGNEDLRDIYVNLHSTGTAGDEFEVTNVLSALSLDRIAGFSATKSQTGHLMGAAGTVESIFSLLAIRDNIIPPTLKLDDPVDEAIGLPIFDQATPRHIEAVLNSSFGFGGLNNVLLFRRWVG